MKLKYFLATLIILMSCNKNESEGSGSDLKLLPSTMGMVEGTRAAGSSFFVAGDQIALAVTDNGVTGNFTYAYNNGTFTGINPSNTYRFYMDDHAIATIKALWPAVRPATFVTDQRLDENFKMSDYLSATINNVMSTPNYVPIEFAHENSKIIFMVTGQNAHGQAITSLVVNVGEVGYWAHPDASTGFAELIMQPGPVYIYAGNIAGLMTVGGFQGAVIFDKTETYTLKANTSYIVSLSPRGDNMIASISIGGWWQDENGVGVPIIKQGDYYQISTEAQLYAVAQLINRYTPDSGGVDWTSAKFQLSGDIVRSSRTWVPVKGFKGVFDNNNFTITPDIVFSN